MTRLHVRAPALRFAAALAVVGSMWNLAPAARAQEPGERLWAVDVQNLLTANGYAGVGRPRVGPDGTIYVGADSLYALAPDGAVRWTAPVWVGTIDVGPDGTVYAGGGSTVYAFAPDGTLRWSFTEQPQGFGITTGPTVGPDGNIYAVTVQGGLGAFSLTPDGALRWNVPGFLTSDGAEADHVAFGPANLYYADEGLWLIPGCPAPYDGLVSISLDGELEWCRSISGVEDPPIGVQATRDGRAIVIQNALPDHYIQAYTPDGALDWTQTFFPSNVGVGPDNHVYAWHDGSALVSLTADGVQRWRVVQPINNFPWRAEVAPDTSAVVAGSVYGFGENGRIVAADPADGSTLWAVDVTGPSAGVGGPVAFSPDGAVVYVPISTISNDEPDELWAIQVRNARATATDPAAGAGALALSAPVPSPAAGRASLTLSLAEPQAVRVEVVDALGRRVAVLHDGPLGAGAHPLALDAGALAPGAYVVRAMSADGARTTRRLVVAR